MPILLLAVSPVWGGTLWEGNFRTLEPGNLLTQDKTWSDIPPGPDVPTEMGALVFSDARESKVLKFYVQSREPGRTGEGYEIRKDLAAIPEIGANTESPLRISVDLKSDVGRYRGKQFLYEIGGADGPVCSVIYGGGGWLEFNGTGVEMENPAGWNRITMALDTAATTASLFVNDKPVAERPFLNTMGPTGLSHLRFQVQLQYREGTKYMDAYIGHVKVEVGEGTAEGPGLDGLTAEGVPSYKLEYGERVFADRPFVWQQLNTGLEHRTALRHELADNEPATVGVKEPGRLLALLWVWDFGFVNDGPQPAENINGWQLVDGNAAAARGHPRPLGLYASQMRAGDTVDLKAYFGRWIIVGFERDGPEASTTAGMPALTLADARTRHNIVDPGRNVTLQAAPEAELTGAHGSPVADRALYVCELYDEGERLLAVEHSGQALRDGIESTQAKRRDSQFVFEFAAPERPGRYWLQVGRKADSRRTVLPLTVALPPIENYASLENMFSVSSWVRGGDPDPICPDLSVWRELDVIDQLELGINTFFVGHDAPLVNALNGRKIGSAGNTKYALSTGADDPAGSAGTIMWLLGQNAPFGPEVLGIYVADEPLKDHELFQNIETLYRKDGKQIIKGDRPLPHLLYCMISYGDSTLPDFWKKSESTARMARMYPILGRGRSGRSLTPIAGYLGWIEQLQGYGGDIPDAPLILVMQTFGHYLLWSAPTGGQIRLMANLALSRGVKGLSYYCYGTNRKRDWNGIVNYPFLPKDDRYGAVKTLGRRLTDLGEILPRLNWRGGIEQKDVLFDVQYLTDKTDGTEYIWVTNWDFVKAHEGRVVVDRVMLQETSAFKELAVQGDSLVALPGGETITIEKGSEFPITLEPGAGQMYRIRK